MKYSASKLLLPYSIVGKTAQLDNLSGLSDLEFSLPLPYAKKQLSKILNVLVELRTDVVSLRYQVEAIQNNISYIGEMIKRKYRQQIASNFHGFNCSSMLRKPCKN